MSRPTVPMSPSTTPILRGAVPLPAKRGEDSVNFTATVAIDWSGAKGRRHKGIAIAEARGGDAPRLVRPGHVWSRSEVLDWLVERAAARADPVRVRLQLRPAVRSSAAPTSPASPASPTDARAFWAYVDRHAPDDDLGAASFLEAVHRKHFYFGIADGVKADFVHFRQLRRRAQRRRRAQDRQRL